MSKNKRMYYYFNKDITVDNINELVDKLQVVDGEVNLYFSTDGGSPDAMEFLINYLNTKKDEVIITLTDWVMSAGTILLTEFKGKIILGEKLDFFMFHLVDRESYNLRKRTIDKKLAKQDFKRNKIFAKKLKEKRFLTDKQIEKFLKGKDVYIYKKQFKKWKL